MCCNEKIIFKGPYIYYYVILNAYVVCNKCLTKNTFGPFDYETIHGSFLKHL